MKIEIRSNILGDIAKIRKGVVFKEPATVIDELLQNCQRAQAKVVNVELQESTLMVHDDGVGCSDPQAVFEKNTTAWGNEDEAFGEGFFSVFLLADTLHVESCDWQLDIDVLDMMKTGNLKIVVKKLLEQRKGFKVVLSGEKIHENRWALKEEVVRLGQIMQIPVFLNGNPVMKKSLFSITSDGYDEHFDNDIYEAVLTPRDSFAYISLYYENRHVKEHYATGVKGAIAFKKGQITLKAPDRKELIWDDRNRKFEKQLREDTESLFKGIVATADNKTIDQYADAINEILDVEDYVNVLTVDNDLFDTLRFRKDEKQEETIKFVEDHFSEHAGTLRSMLSILANAFDDKPKQDVQSRSGDKLIDTIKKDRRLAWVSGENVEETRDDVANAEYLGFRVIVARNKLYAKVFEHLHVPNVAQLKDRLVEHSDVQQVGSKSKKEERFIMLMHKIEEHLHIPIGSIQFATLKLLIKIEQFDFTEIVDEKQIEGCCSIKDERIYLSRDVLDWTTYRAQEPDYQNVTIHDYRVLLVYLPIVAHELAHFCFGTLDNTPEHRVHEERMYKEIIKLF